MVSDSQWVNGFMEGLKAGRGKLPFDPQNQDDQYRNGYFEGYCDGKEDASSEIWTPYTFRNSFRVMSTHDWELADSEDYGDGIEEIVEICPCNARRHSLVTKDENDTVLKQFYFKVRPDPLFRCEHTGRIP